MIIGADYTFAGHERWNLGWPTPNYAAAFLVTLLPWVWGSLLLVKPKVIAWPKQLAGGALVVLEGLLWFFLIKTYSRGGLVAAVLAGIYFAFQTRGCVSRRELTLASTIRGTVLLAIIAATGFYARLSPNYTMDDLSVSNRLNLWRGGLKMIAAAPVKGWGAGESGRAFMNWFQVIGNDNRYTTMVNSYLHVAVEYGLPLLAVIAAGLWGMISPPSRLSTVTGGITPKSTPLICGVRASILAWAAVNIFTTLWIDPRLWIVPAVAATLILISFGPVSRAVIFKHVVGSVCIGLVAAIGLYGAGLILSRQESLSIAPGQAESVIAVRGNMDLFLQRRNGPGRTWEAWPDRAVLGATPGQELRIWLQAQPKGSRLVVHAASDAVGHDGRADVLMFFGRQCERIKDLAASDLRSDEIWLIHPFNHASPPIPDISGNAHIIVVIPEIDQWGQNDFWRAWAQANHAQILVSPGVGTDVRMAWPKIVEPASLSGAGTSPLTSVEEIPSVNSNGKGGSSPAPPFSLWIKLQAALQGIALNGTWRQSYFLGTGYLLQLLNFWCRLDPRLEVDAYGQAHTAWLIPGLQTWLVPAGREKLVWQPPGGSPVEFGLVTIGDKFPGKDSAQWKIRRAGPATYELRAPTGATWVYLYGLLTHIDQPGLGGFDVHTKGGLIREIRRADEPAASPLFAADFNEAGNPTRFTVGKSTNIFVWSKGLLLAWSRSDGHSVHFSYTDGLISQISEQGKPVQHLTWAQNPDFARGDSRWPYPVHLCTDDFFEYRYEVTTEGYLVRITNDLTHETVSAIYNPLRRQLKQRVASGALYIVTFWPNRVGNMPEKIQDQNGILLTEQ